ncbi:MAG: ABC transporter ATP-binding protein [Clostridiales bacterium]|jgi:iron complex transport system ATP-binding protein|nr:ABC transporter ATP-binding protein [Clostridiales bacterium]
MIRVKELSFYYNRDRMILDKINFCAPKGQCTAILGNNGAGKSTLIKCLNRILEPRQGAVFVDGKNIKELGRKDIAKYIAYAAQGSTGGRFTVFDSVLLGRKPYIKLEPSKEDFGIVESVIKRMGIEKLALRYTDELSGGEIQKVMLARALAQQPRVLLLDEPTGSLDLGNQHEVLAEIRQIAETEQICVIIVIHDLNLALRYCDNFLFLKDKRVFSFGGVETITPESVKEVYKTPVTVREIGGVMTVVPFPC